MQLPDDDDDDGDERKRSMLCVASAQPCVPASLRVRRGELQIPRREPCHSSCSVVTLQHKSMCVSPPSSALVLFSILFACFRSVPHPLIFVYSFPAHTIIFHI